jgi:hypothetical protein
MKIILKWSLWDLCVGLKRDEDQASVCDGVCNILIQWRGKRCAVEQLSVFRKRFFIIG